MNDFNESGICSHESCFGNFWHHLLSVAATHSKVLVQLAVLGWVSSLCILRNLQFQSPLAVESRSYRSSQEAEYFSPLHGWELSQVAGGFRPDLKVFREFGLEGLLERFHQPEHGVVVGSWNTQPPARLHHSAVDDVDFRAASSVNVLPH